ncbi:Ger(x)C family spore germination protein [Metabacillus niabensis]|uniref:Ger(X)C family germination protein n=1 Tax=Metabacillus niabensis TaxID=324854 RepID=A0ABT9Z2F0_9BACI|nr:Ger(x)C family spore germination protein [Metabacillus niabensis]MDQ0226129.1 Ger(x)C family germination protein [Metabacillus niabensis]
MNKIVWILISLLFLTGCADIKEVQYQAYAVGLGIDYNDNQYEVTLQFLDFLNVAKTDQGKGDKPSKVWLGNGKGKSIEDAINQIDQGIQLPINFDQINVIVFGKSLLKNKLESTLQTLDSSYRIRLTGMVYGTEEPIEKVFTSKVPFYYPFNESQISNPEAKQQQSSTVPPINLQQFIYQFNEKARTILLPSLTVNNEIIKEEEDNYDVPTINGAHIIKGKHWKGHVSLNHLIGFVRVNNKSVRTPLTLDLANHQILVNLLKPKMKYVVNNDKKDPSIGLEIKIHATVLNSNGMKLSKDIKNQIKKKLVNEVYHSYEKSKEIDGDIFQFENYLYRHRHDLWQSIGEGDFPELKKDNIHIKIDRFKSVHKLSGMYQ